MRIATNGSFFFHFLKADRTNKTDDICFKYETNCKFKNKSKQDMDKKEKQKINHGSENRLIVNSNKTKLCVL